MTADLAARLRVHPDGGDPETSRILYDAADEIERLHAALSWIAAMPDESNEWEGVERFREARQRAIDALGQDKR